VAHASEYVEAVYRQVPPTPWIAFVLALVGGTLLALGHVVGGLIVVGFALLCGWAAQRTRDDGDDHSGLY
jgi:hypothetical protein